MRKPRSTISIDTNPVADAYRSLADEKRIEFSATRRDITEDGSFRTLLGGLISFRVLRADGGRVPEDRLIVTVHRTDPNIEVRWEQPQDTRAADIERLTALAESRGLDELDMAETVHALMAAEVTEAQRAGMAGLLRLLLTVGDVAGIEEVIRDASDDSEDDPADDL